MSHTLLSHLRLHPTWQYANSEEHFLLSYLIMTEVISKSESSTKRLKIY